MATTSNKALNDAIRAQYLERAKEFFIQEGEEVIITGNNEFCIPCVDSAGNEKWVQVVMKVPTGSRDDNEPFDGYAMAEDYKLKQEAKAAKAAENAKKKEEKRKKNEAARKAKAEEKAKREKEKG